MADGWEDSVLQPVPHPNHSQHLSADNGKSSGLQFCSVGVNMFMAEFENQRDRYRVWGGSPWQVSKNTAIPAEFGDCMQPNELNFDRLRLWARIMNLPYSSMNDGWGLSIAH